MDINANLAEQRRIVAAFDTDRGPDADVATLARLVDLVEAMDEWISKGGALPAIWEANRPKQKDIEE